MRPSRPTLRSLAAAVALLALPAPMLHAEPPAQSDEAAAQPAGEQSPGCPVLREADRLLGQADSASGAAVRWLRANVSAEVIAAVSESAQSAAECRWRALVAEARVETERDLGVFLFTPGSGVACNGDWTPLGDVAHLSSHRRVVLLVHGLDEPGGIWDDLAPALTDAGFTVARFNYPNDQDPALSADGLAEAMRALRSEIGAARVDLVCHSMGGLVGRDVLTRPAFYAGDARAHDGLPAVGNFITIGTPNHGSPLAPLRALGEIREHVERWVDSDEGDTGALLGFLADGDGAAGDALDPDSAYLADLNGRPLPAGVKMTVIVGRVSPVTSEDVSDLLDRSWLEHVLGAQRAERLRAQANEAVGMLGDAIVTVDSARLDGVADTVILEANHRSLVRHIPLADSVRRLLGDDQRVPPAIPVIVNRLGEEAE